MLRNSWTRDSATLSAMAEETSAGGKRIYFENTHWSMVLQAKDGSEAELERLISAAWKPVYFFIRRKGNGIEDAKDLTQGFFTAFVEKDFLKSVSPEKGKFRTFILAAVTHFLSNEYDKKRTKKRGGGMNFTQVEESLSDMGKSPEEVFFRGWASEIMGLAMDLLRTRVKEEDFLFLQGLAPADLPTEEKKHRRYRIRLKLRQALTDVLFPLVGSEEEVEEEIRELFSSLS